MLARHAADPKKEHGEMMKYLGRYLRATRDKGMTYKVNRTRSFDIWCDADFSGNWVKDEDQSDDPSSAKSRSGYVITYFGCPVLWASKLQSEIALSTTEAEVLSLSAATRDAIPLMWLLEEIHQRKLIKSSLAPKVHCRIFEDNSGAVEIAKVPKIRPRTKHINCKYFHFRSFVDNNKMSVHATPTEEQAADYLTKNLSYKLFAKHRKFIQGW